MTTQKKVLEIIDRDGSYTSSLCWYGERLLSLPGITGVRNAQKLTEKGVLELKDKSSGSTDSATIETYTWVRKSS